MSEERLYPNLTNKFKIYLSTLSIPINKYFRIEVITGGCAGFQYHFSVSDLEKDDIIINIEDRVITDSTSIKFLESCTIDYQDEMFFKSIKISNPNYSNTCGCGVSFS